MKKTTKKIDESLDARITLRVPRTVLQALKHIAIDRGQSLQMLCLDMLTQLADKGGKR